MLLSDPVCSRRTAAQQDDRNSAATLMQTRCWATVLCGLILSPLTAWAQDGGARVNADENPVKVYVDVRDDAGRPVAGLDAAAFQISENNSAQALESVTTPDAGAVSVIFLMDYSGSMEESGAVAVMQQAVTDALAKLNSNDRAAIIKFSGSVDTLSILGFTNDFQSLRDFLTTTPMTVRGSIIFDAVNAALELFSAAQATLPSSSHSVILLTDGVDEGSNLTLAGIKDELDDAGVSVFTVGLGKQLDDGVLEELSRVSGGDYAVAEDVAAVGELYDEVTEGLTSEYVLIYNSAVGLTDCTPQTLQLQVDTPTGPHTYHTDFRRCIPDPPPGSTTNNNNGGSNSGGSPVLVADSNGGGTADMITLLLLPLVALFRRRQH